MSDAIQIRRAIPSDFAFIVESNITMAHETEDLSLDGAKVRVGVGAVLADSSLGFYLVAEIDGNPAGQLMVTYEWSDWRNALWWWIQSVFVRPQYRGAASTAPSTATWPRPPKPPVESAACASTSSRKTPSPSRSISPWTCTPPATTCTKSNSETLDSHSVHPELV